MIRDAHKESIKHSRKSKKEKNEGAEHSHHTHPGITELALPALNVR